MTKFKIPHSKPYLPPKTKELVNQVLDSGWLTSGPMVERFESKLAEWSGFNHAICTSSGTTALSISAQCLHERLVDLKSKIEPVLLIPTFTYSATANAIIPIFKIPRSKFVGGSLEYPMVDWPSIAHQLESHYDHTPTLFVSVSIAGRQTNPIIVPASDHWSFLDDSAHCIPVNKKQATDFISCTSFWPSKMITTGEGGCVFTDSDSVASWIRKHISHSIETGPFPWNRKCTSMMAANYRMSDINAAVGLAQVIELDNIIPLRRLAAAVYREELDDLMFRDQDGDQYQMLLIQVDPVIRDSLVLYLRAHSIEASVHYDPPLHKQAAYRGVQAFNVTKDHFSGRLVTLPIYPGILSEDIKFVCDHVKQFLKSCPVTTSN